MTQDHPDANDPTINNNNNNNNSSSSPQPPPADHQQLIQLIHSNRTTPIPNLSEILGQTNKELFLTHQDQDQDQDLLHHLISPDLDSLAYFHILSCRLEHPQSKLDPIRTLSHAHRFCSTITRKQLHLISPSHSFNLYQFVQHLLSCSSHAAQLQSCIEPLVKLIKSYGPYNILTPLHHELLNVCLRSRMIKSAVELTNLDIDIDQENYPIRYQDHLIYHYLAGIVQALNKNYLRATHLLTIAVSAPGPSISQIQLDAYKKLLLISLLRNSSQPVLPPYTNPQFKSAFKSISQNKFYLEFTDLYELADTTHDGYLQLLAMTEKNLSSFQKDNNLGLVKLCIESLPRKAIKKLIPIYTSIPISTLDSSLMNLTGVEVGTLIKSMIESGELNGEIEPSKNVLNFHEGNGRRRRPLVVGVDDQSNHHEGEGAGLEDHQTTHETLKSIVKNVQSIEVEIKRTSFEIERNREYLKRLIQDVKINSNSTNSANNNENLHHQHNHNNSNNQYHSDANHDKSIHSSTTNEFYPSIVSNSTTRFDPTTNNQHHQFGLDRNQFGSMIMEEDLAVDVGMAWDD